VGEAHGSADRDFPSRQRRLNSGVADATLNLIADLTRRFTPGYSQPPLRGEEKPHHFSNNRVYKVLNRITQVGAVFLGSHAPDPVLAHGIQETTTFQFFPGAHYWALVSFQQIRTGSIASF
jgi:hypothetical protein